MIARWMLNAESLMDLPSRFYVNLCEEQLEVNNLGKIENLYLETVHIKSNRAVSKLSFFFYSISDAFMNNLCFFYNDCWI